MCMILFKYNIINYFCSFYTDNQMQASAPVMKKSVELPPQKRDKHVRAVYPYDAREPDELNLQPGLIN